MVDRLASHFLRNPLSILKNNKSQAREPPGETPCGGGGSWTFLDIKIDDVI
jgi:hypothetical protein